MPVVQDGKEMKAVGLGHQAPPSIALALSAPSPDGSAAPCPVSSCPSLRLLALQLASVMDGLMGSPFPHFPTYICKS